jgi:hypothetical protein
MTVDQAESRTQDDMVEPMLAQLGEVVTLLPFTRTVGDEFQGLLADPMSVVDVSLDLMRSGSWHIGIGIGRVDGPLPDDVRRARGPAFLAARTAVEAAKRGPAHVSVASAPEVPEARDADVAVRLVGALRERRTEPGWQAVDLIAEGLTQAEIAGRLQVSRQAVGQRLQAAQWSLELEARPLLARLLARAEEAAVRTGQPA